MDYDMVLKATGVVLCLAVFRLARHPVARAAPGRGNYRMSIPLLGPLGFLAAESLVRLGKYFIDGLYLPLPEQAALIGVGFVLAGAFSLAIPGRRAAVAGVSRFGLRSSLLVVFAVWAGCVLTVFSLPFAVTSLALYAIAALLGLDLNRIESPGQEADVLETAGILLLVAGVYLAAGPLFPDAAQTSGVKLFAPQGQSIGTPSILILGLMLILALGAGYYFSREKRSEK